MDDLRVILEVQRHRILYDPSNPFYKDNYRKEQAWSEVAAALRADPADCKSRWRILRDSYVKHLKKVSVSNGPPGGAQRDWKFSTNMSFIMPFVQNRAPKRRLRPTSDADCERSGLSSSLDPSPGLPASPLPLWTAPLEEDRPSATEGDREELHHFALSTVPLLLRLGKRQRRRAKMEILQTLDRLEEEEEQQAAARRYFYPPATEASGAGVQRPPASVQRAPSAAQRAPAATQRPPACPQPSAWQDQDTAVIKVETEEQLSAVCVKIEESRQTEHRQDRPEGETPAGQTQAEDMGSEAQFHSETEGQSSDTDNDDDWEPM